MADSLSDNELAEIEAAFKMFDKNGDGQISVDELSEAMREAGQCVSEEELIDMIKAVDVNGNGKVEYKEFVCMMASQMGKPISFGELKTYFNQFDKDGNGFIDATEMKCLVKAFWSNLKGDQLTQQVDSMIKQADKNRDGKISFEEFQKAVSLE